MLERITDLLARSSEEAAAFPATVLYNEGWMLRLVLDAFDRHRGADHLLSPLESARWFSEPLLPSAFLPRSRTDLLGESWTHADGVVGHITIGLGGRADLSLAKGAAQFVVVEAKMFSRLSSGVSHARYYDQAARNVGCIAEVLARAETPARDLSRLGFYLVAPQSQIDRGLFASLMTKESIYAKVDQRVRAYEGSKDAWFAEWFEPTLHAMSLGCLSWEQVMGDVSGVDPSDGVALRHFYDLCVRFNKVGAVEVEA